jgi:uncharacterized membrane protein
MNPLWLTILLSISPISELRGGIPYALSQGFSIWKAFSICVLANILIVLFIMLFLTFFHNLFLKIRWYEKSFGLILRRIEKKSKKIEKSMKNWGYLALFLFVAIPLPITGAWTGTLISWFLGLDKIKSFFAIALGVILAGIIVSLVSMGIIGIFKF